MSTSSQPFTQILLTAFLGVLVAAFIGFGITAFYPAPQAPEYPTQLEKPAPSTGETAEMTAARTEFDQKNKDFQEKRKDYSRVVAGAALVAAILVLVISLTFFHATPVIADGLLLGGVFTTLYSVGHALTSGDARFQFIIVTVGLVIAFAIVYLKFVKPARLQEK